MTRQSHGTGQFTPDQFARLGRGVIIEPGVLVFHPENILIGDDVYVGHQTILKAYYRNTLIIGDGTWIGQQCFFHSAGGLTIGCNVGIGPGVRIITSHHAEEGVEVPILRSRIEFAPVVIEDDSDLGVGATILPGVTIGRGAQVGAGAVVTADVPPYAIVAGVPARLLRYRADK
jgi:acetyltransferase-like isoleucine patch superfamily enzyme